MDAIVRALATGLGCGRFPFAPATFASFVLIALLYVLPTPSPLGWGVLVGASVAIGIPVSTRAEKFYGHDGSPIVIDEVAGVFVTLALVPPSLGAYVAGFFLFRLFDIVKPFPAGRAQSLPRGTGVVMDDVVAGIYAHLALRLALPVLGS